MNIDFEKVCEWNSYLERLGLTGAEVGGAREICDRAKQFLSKFAWCSEIVGTYVGFIYVGVVAVFLFEIKPSRTGVDDWVWVIVGDLPSAYITCEDSRNPASALDAYIGAMEDWVAAAMRGSDVSKLIPVNVDPTVDNAVRLNNRLKFLDERILINYKNDLVSG